MRHPVGAELLENAQWREGDVFWRKNLAYCSSTFAGDGFALVGDAAAFLDPFYSPGMDWISFTAWSSAQLILAQQRGESIAPLIEKHNCDFARSYRCWFEAVYQDKYEYLGDFDLMRTVFQLDLGLYYLGIASQPFKYGAEALNAPPFSTRPSIPFFHLMRFYNRRFAKIARARRKRGVFGLKNVGRRFLIPGFTFSGTSAWPVLKACLAWGCLEITEGWRSWFSAESKSQMKSESEIAPNAVAKVS